MTNQQDSQLSADSEEKESGFPLRVLVVIELHGVLIKKDSLSLREGYTVFALVLPVLLFIPFESQRFNNYNVGIS